MVIQFMESSRPPVIELDAQARSVGIEVVSSKIDCSEARRASGEPLRFMAG